jgi:hypothetical protein
MMIGEGGEVGGGGEVSVVFVDVGGIGALVAVEVGISRLDFFVIRRWLVVVRLVGRGFEIWRDAGCGVRVADEVRLNVALTLASWVDGKVDAGRLA